MKFPKLFRRKSRKEKPVPQAENTASPLVEEAKEEISNTDEQVKQTSSPLRIIYSGHRGSGANEVQYELPEDERTPENSLASFKKAFKDGVECIEFDVYKTKDNVLMVTHSNDLAENATFNRYLSKDEMYPNPEEHLISEKTAHEIQTQFNIAHIPSEKYHEDGTYECVDLDTGENAKKKDFDDYLNNYTIIPTFQDLLLATSEENAKRKANGLPNIKLNMELKGQGAGKLTDDHIQTFNSTQSDENKIDYKDIYFLSFNQQELFDVAQQQPDANIILAVPTIHTYVEADKETFRIIDCNLNVKELDKQVLGFNEKLKEIPDRGRGLDGVDMVLWDIGDEVLDYYGKHQIPINIAVSPYGKTNLEHEYLQPSLENIKKIAEIQGSYYEKEEKPFIFVKTDVPSELQRIVEQGKQSEGKEKIVSAKEYSIGNNKKATEQKIPMFEKPRILYTERVQSENELDSRQNSI
ncbi:MAG: hypothetical protein COV35_00685 [Alphaproteobacteria bacterium CG11_big_fil_rev_8_21_14_0_20_39_49]|nr:MAG: hypothetical protein COV35_00685 [Alphaproteobacteria bacterium CG11_big_fil_rev_8_21_14_0_20_39_49]